MGIFLKFLDRLSVCLLWMCIIALPVFTAGAMFSTEAHAEVFERGAIYAIFLLVYTAIMRTIAFFCKKIKEESP